MPVGGYKQSGVGRENSLTTLVTTQIKSVQVELGEYVSYSDLPSPFEPQPRWLQPTSSSQIRRLLRISASRFRIVQAYKVRRCGWNLTTSLSVPVPPATC